ncbi:extracellular solute-binding protein [Halorussus salinisoli]|uniref:extracellular solute-binding protein n=1 Tax=Halorussus salinisoli TaxID=2558242 RepID=UPI001484E25C|nr:extracellular solute-binding protein [Halorussus salinisoli]
MSSRRDVLRQGAGLLAAGSAAGVGALAVRPGADAEDSSESGEDSTLCRANVLVAGSLQRLASEFGDASVEAHGSVACRRLLEDGLRDPDAVALADPTLFSGMAERVTCFATNALVVAYRPESVAARHDDWRALVADSDLSLGRTDPERDPLGYRTAMALDLAEGIDVESVLARTDVFPETGLLRTLEAGGIDAAFAYRNMAVEHDLPSLVLPDRIDFSDPALADEYAGASVELADRTVSGSPIRYAAHARTDRGREWVRALASAHETLRAAGFGVPEGYPKEKDVRDAESENQVSKSGRSSGAS